VSADPSNAGSPHYARAPILEASITINVEPLPVERFAILGMVGEKLGASYPKAWVLSDFRSGYLEVSPGISGMVFATGDGRMIVQARSDGFSFSQREPYENWDTFLTAARGAWECYKLVVAPSKVLRLTIKYVNSIKFPTGVPLRQLFNTYPAAPDPDWLFESVSMHYRVSLSELPGLQLSVLMINNGTQEERGKMLIDNTFAIRVPNEDVIWEMMPAIRKIKNGIFESQLTPQLKATFNG
jgi:uncharacterized protein (TIGR04255 family)